MTNLWHFKLIHYLSHESYPDSQEHTSVLQRFSDIPYAQKPVTVFTYFIRKLIPLPPAISTFKWHKN